MGEISKDILTLLTQLLPGFVVAWVVYGLTSFPKPAQFERVIQALIYSFLVAALVTIEEACLTFLGRIITFGPWDKQSELIASAISALALGLILSYFASNDKFYAFARKRGLTRRTAYPSEWFGAFSEHPRYVTLHIDGNRRITGYPLDWPSDPSVGHFKLIYAAWVNDDRTEVPLDGDHSILIPASKVELVEFLKYVEESKNGTETAKPATTTSADTTTA